MVYNFIPKNQTFRVLLISSVSFSQNTPYSITPVNQAGVNIAVCSISKDGGAYAPATNVGVFIFNGAYYLDLTAAEMNANRIDIVCGSTDGSGAGNRHITGASIFTVANELSAAPTIASSLADKINAIFQYLFLKRTVTSTQEKLYKSDDTTVLATGTLSDDSTTFTKGKPA